MITSRITQFSRKCRKGVKSPRRFLGELGRITPHDTQQSASATQAEAPLYSPQLREPPSARNTVGSLEGALLSPPLRSY